MNIAFDAKRYFHNHTGLGNYSRTLVGNLQLFHPEHHYTLLDERALQRTFHLGHKAAEAGAEVLMGLSNELPFDIDRHKASPVRGIVTMHDVAWRTFPEMYHLPDRMLYDWKYGSSCRRAHHVICISESTRRDVMRFYGVEPERISAVYQPVQNLFYNPLSEAEVESLVGAEPDYILYVGSINSRKNLLALLEALTLLTPENRPRLIVVGNGREYRQRVEAYIAQHHLQAYVDIRSNVSDNRVLQALYTKAQAFVYPSFYEGFGLPIVEAALQQTPIITTNVSSLPEAAGPDAFYFDPHASDAAHQLAEHLSLLLSDRDLRRQKGQQMEAYARATFDPERLTHQLMETIK